eukprot:2346375-Rhodomonas_salina.1
MQVERLKGSYFFKNDEGYEQARTGDPYLTPFPSLSRFFVCPPPFQEMMRLCLSWEDDSDIVLGVGRLFVGNVPEHSGQAITVRSGGHNWFGASLRDGCVLIDLGDMKSIAVDASTKTAQTGWNCWERSSRMAWSACYPREWTVMRDADLRVGAAPGLSGRTLSVCAAGRVSPGRGAGNRDGAMGRWVRWDRGHDRGQPRGEAP